MKKLFKILAIALCLTMVVPFLVPVFGAETVQAENILENQRDILHDYKSYNDDWNDDLDDDFYDEKEYNYDNVKKTFEKVSISQEGGHTFSSIFLEDGKTNVYPIDIEKKAEYIIGLDDSDGEGAILIVDASGNNVYEKEVNLNFTSWKKRLPCQRGDITLKFFQEILEILIMNYLSNQQL